MNALTVIPSPGAPIGSDQLLAIERSIIERLPTVNDMDMLEEWQNGASALVQYLKGKELHGPAMGMQRRIEARIGQLLGETEQGERTDLTYTSECKLVPRQDRNRFRILARGMGLLTDEEWRSPREPLIRLLQKRFPMPRRQPDIVVQKDGVTKKSRTIRIKEIATFSGQGHRASQIAKELSISTKQVKKLAREGNIALPDHKMGRGHGLKCSRVVEQTVNGLEGFALGLRSLDGLPWDIDAEDAIDLMQSLAKSMKTINTLYKRLKETVSVKDPII